tara:strand:+ start:2316 stop:2438 length:123 start_codon:yes stop_codon:yes gene_type:complete
MAKSGKQAKNGLFCYSFLSQQIKRGERRKENALPSDEGRA